MFSIDTDYCCSYYQSALIYYKHNFLRKGAFGNIELIFIEQSNNCKRKMTSCL